MYTSNRRWTIPKEDKKRKKMPFQLSEKGSRRQASLKDNTSFVSKTSEASDSFQITIT